MIVFASSERSKKDKNNNRGGRGIMSIDCNYARTSNYTVIPRSYFHHHHHQATIIRCTITDHKLLHTKQPALSVLNPPRSDDPSLQSTWTHRAWVTTGCATLLYTLAKSITTTAESTSHISFLEPTLATVAGYILSDLGSGIYHWGIDNYGDQTTPIFGSQIAAFQGHHKFPWTITKRQFANNLHALARAIVVFVIPINILACNNPAFLAFAGVFAGCIMFSQQFHAWAHGTKSKLPKLVLVLQELGVLVSRKQHGAHHRPPYNNNYCIVSGVWNEFLDQNSVFEAMELIIFFRFGVRPRSWSEPSLEWVEQGDDAHE